MSRMWTEHEYIYGTILWEFIDQYRQRLDILQSEDSVKTSELCKINIMGRLEVLEALAECLATGEMRLGEIVINLGIFTEEEVERLVKEEYGA
jgi:hypothetical protein